MPEIGKRIKARRIEIRMTQSELAAKVGYKDKSTIAKIESGANDITQTKVVEFAKALDTTIAYLMGWEEGKETLVISKDGELSPMCEDPQQARLRTYYEKFKKLTPEHQIAVTTMIDFLASEEAKEKEIKSQSSKEA